MTQINSISDVKNSCTELNSYRYQSDNPFFSIFKEEFGNKYQVVSAFKLKKEELTILWNLGLLGSSQEFCIYSQCDGKEEPWFEEKVPLMEFHNTGRRTGKVNKLNTLKKDYYVYCCGPKENYD